MLVRYGKNCRRSILFSLQYTSRSNHVHVHLFACIAILYSYPFHKNKPIYHSPTNSRESVQCRDALSLRGDLWREKYPSTETSVTNSSGANATAQIADRAKTASGMGHTGMPIGVMGLKSSLPMWARTSLHMCNLASNLRGTHDRFSGLLFRL